MRTTFILGAQRPALTESVIVDVLRDTPPGQVARFGGLALLRPN